MSEESNSKGEDQTKSDSSAPLCFRVLVIHILTNQASWPDTDSIRLDGGVQ